MPDVRALQTTDRKARAFLDGVAVRPVCIGKMPPQLSAQTPAALWLTTKGARAIVEMEKKVLCKKAGMELATDIARARWRQEEGRIVAESDFFAFAFTAAPDGWHLTECRMLWTARTDLRSYLRIFGDFSHSPARGVLPDFYLRDLTEEEIKESGLREGAALSVSSAKMKQLGRRYNPKKRAKNIRATLNEWRDTGGMLSDIPKADAQKNARIILPGKKEG